MYHPTPSMLMVVHGIGSQLDVNNNIRKSFHYDYANGNFPLLYQLLSSAADVCRETDCDRGVEIFNDILYRCIDPAIPKRVDRGAYGGRRNIRNKNELYKLCRPGNATDF